MGQNSIYRFVRFPQAEQDLFANTLYLCPFRYRKPVLVLNIFCWFSLNIRTATWLAELVMPMSFEDGVKKYELFVTEANVTNSPPHLGKIWELMQIYKLLSGLSLGTSSLEVQWTIIWDCQCQCRCHKTLWFRSAMCYWLSLSYVCVMFMSCFVLKISIKCKEI